MKREANLIRSRTLSMGLALLLAIGIATPFAPTAVHAQADEISQRDFDDLLDAAEEEDPIFGPEDGELEHDPDVVAFAFAGVETSDFVASATFVNPYSGSSQQFDFGIQFRAISANDEAVYARFIVISTGVWAIFETGNEDLVASGEYGDLDIKRNGENDLTVVADGDLVHVAINGDYVGSAEVAFDGAGDIGVGTSFLGDSFQEGAVTEYTDFTIWSDEAASGGRTGGDDEGDDPDPDTGGTSYEAEAFTFRFTYGDEWELSSSSSSDDLEFIQLTTEASILQIVVGQIWDDQQACIEALLGTVLTNLEEQDITGSVDSPGISELDDSPFPGTFGIEVAFEPDRGVDFDDTTIYVECGPAGTNEYLVGVVQIVPSDLYEAEADLRKDIVATFNQEDSGNGGNSGTGGNAGQTGSQLSANVIEDEDGNRFYISPSFGFIVGILPGFTIEQDSVANGYDTLVIADAISRVTVSGFASTNTPSGCIDSILVNLRNDPTISAVEIALDTEGEPFRYDDAGQAEIAVYLTFNTGGKRLDLGRYYACFANDARTSMLVVAYETQADVFADEFDNVDTMLGLIRVP